MRRPPLRALLLVVLLAALTACGAGRSAARPSNPGTNRAETSHRGVSAPSPLGAPGSYAATSHLKAGPNLLHGSEPSALPGDVLIADRDNNRLLVVSPTGRIVWRFPEPGDLAPGQTFRLPDDAFFTPNGKDIIATEENDSVISQISIARHRIIWRYGHPGVPGSARDYLDNPDDAMMLRDGDLVTADIKNCRLLVLRPPLHRPIRRIGSTTHSCYHQPPTRWGSPNGVFPMTDGNYIVTEINGDWADEMNLATDRVLRSVHPPGFSYPSDTNEVRPGVFISADYTDPGQVEEFTPSGHLLWRYSGAGSAALDSPSLALPLSNGDILLNDDKNNRVVVIDKKTHRVVWQYGHTGVAGNKPGYLSNPDGVDLLPPYSLTMRFAEDMGLP